MLLAPNPTITRRLWPLVVAALALITGSGCKPPADAVIPPEPWASQPKTAWPAMVLTNEATLKGVPPLSGGSAFLVKGPKDEVFVATSRRLLGKKGEPDSILRSELPAALERWIVYPRTAKADSLEIASLVTTLPDKSNDAWLLFRLKAQPAKWAAQPLTLREKHVQPGDVVHLVGCDPDDPSGQQKVYSGKVHNRFGTYFSFSLEPHVDLKGFDGAPILDASGHVVGIMTLWFSKPKMEGTKMTEAGGQDAEVTYIDVMPK